METQIQVDIINLFQAIARMQTQIEIVKLLKQMLQERSVDAIDIKPQTQLRAHLDFESVDVISLIALIEQKYQQKFGFAQLLLKDGQCVEDLSVEEIASFVADKLNQSN